MCFNIGICTIGPLYVNIHKISQATFALYRCCTYLHILVWTYVLTYVRPHSLNFRFDHVHCPTFSVLVLNKTARAFPGILIVSRSFRTFMTGAVPIPVPIPALSGRHRHTARFTHWRNFLFKHPVRLERGSSAPPPPLPAPRAPAGCCLGTPRR